MVGGGRILYDPNEKFASSSATTAAHTIHTVLYSRLREVQLQTTVCANEFVGKAHKVTSYPAS
jgi:hypothetical protein